MDEDSSSDDGSDASVHDHDYPDWEMMLACVPQHQMMMK